MNRYAVRILEPTGRYPEDPLGFVGIAALVADDLAWSAVIDPPGSEEDFEGEIYWLRPSEIRFFAAASLAEADPFVNGRVRVHSGPLLGFLELSPDEAEDPARFLEAGRAFVDEHLPDPESYRLPTGEDRRWKFVEADYHEEAERLLDAMDFGDPLLHRGLSRYLAATELSRHHKFLEEAGLAAFISREAALELLRRKLSAQQSSRAKLDDVLDWIRTEFPTGSSLVGVLERDWEARVLMVHPTSKYGEFWSPPVMAGECFEAIHTLTYLYRFLLLGEPWTPDEDL